MSIAEKLQTIAENEQKVYNAGMQAEYDRFWDEYQEKGNRYHYNYAFNNRYWNDKTYNPKYPFNNVKYYGDMFEGASGIKDTKFPINIVNTSNFYQNVFAQCSSLVTIRTLTFPEVVTFNKWFQNCFALENITFGSMIGNNIDFQWSTKLSKDSITNIIEHLSTTASGKTLTLSKTAVNTAFNMTDGNPSTEWSNLVGTKQNWTISLL